MLSRYGVTAVGLIIFYHKIVIWYININKYIIISIRKSIFIELFFYIFDIFYFAGIDILGVVMCTIGLCSVFFNKKNTILSSTIYVSWIVIYISQHRNAKYWIFSLIEAPTGTPTYIKHYLIEYNKIFMLNYVMSPHIMHL